MSCYFSCRSGSVCLDVINQTWSPMFDLINVFEVFLPQLLSYPNPASPLNPEAAALLMKEPEKYDNRIREYVLKYANDGNVGKESILLAKMEEEKKLVMQSSPQTQPTDAMDIEDDDNIPLSDVSALSELSDLAMIEEY